LNEYDDMLSPGSLYTLVSVAALLATSVTTVVVGRRRSAPGATPLFVLCALLVVTVASQLLLNVPSSVRAAVVEALSLQFPGEYWVALSLGLGIPINGLWLFFAVGYTGRGTRLRRQVAAVVAVAVASCYLLAGYAVVRAGPDEPPVITVVLSLFTGMFFISALASLGSVLVLEAALRRNSIPLREGVALTGGSFLFIYAPAIGVNLDRPVAVPMLLFGAAVSLGLAVRQYSLFETLPAARIAARDRLVDSITEAVLLVDEQARVVDLNPAAAQLFDGADTETQRQPLADVLPEPPDPADLAESGEPTRLRTGRTRLEVTATEVAGEYSESVGYLLVGRDVTEQRRRERRLRVLTQFLAETVCERTATVAGQADLLAANGEDPPEGTDTSALAGEIRRTTASLKQFVATTRRIERSLSESNGATSDLVAVTRQVATEEDNVSLAAETDEQLTVAVDSSVLRAVLDLLVAERLDRGSEQVRITVRSSPDSTANIALRAEPADPRNRPAQPPPQPVTGDRSRIADPVLELCRLALEHGDGTIEHSADDSLHVRFQTGASSAALSGDEQHTGASSDRPAHIHQEGDQP
jgi:PAS domain-containing protein